MLDISFAQLLPHSLLLPSRHLFVAAQLLMDVAVQDLSSADEVRTLLKDIWDIRQAKLRRSVDAFVQSGMQHAKLDHLQLIELNSVRPLPRDRQERRTK